MLISFMVHSQPRCNKHVVNKDYKLKILLTYCIGLQIQTKK